MSIYWFLSLPGGNRSRRRRGTRGARRRTARALGLACGTGLGPRVRLSVSPTCLCACATEGGGSGRRGRVKGRREREGRVKRGRGARHAGPWPRRPDGAAAGPRVHPVGAPRESLGARGAGGGRVTWRPGGERPISGAPLHCSQVPSRLVSEGKFRVGGRARGVVGRNVTGAASAEGAGLPFLRVGDGSLRSPDAWQTRKWV